MNRSLKLQRKKDAPRTKIATGARAPGKVARSGESRQLSEHQRSEFGGGACDIVRHGVRRSGIDL